MNFKRPSFEAIAHVTFVAAAAAILTCGWVLYSASARTTQSTRWVSHTLEVIKAFHDVDERISRAESAQRGYLLTTSATYLEERDQALAAERVAVIAIKELTTDNKDQQRRVSQLEKLNAQRILIMHENERLLQTEGSESVRIRLAAGFGRAATKAIYDLTNDMEQEEMRLLEVRRAAERQRHESTQVAFFAAMFISLAVLIPGYLGLIVQSRARRHAQRKVLDLAESLPGTAYQARSDAHGGSLRFVFVSASSEELFGIARQSVIQNADLIWACVLEEDRRAIAAAVENSARTLKSLRHDFRINRAAGETRWIRCRASVRREPDGSILWNGYWDDISGQKLLEQSLHDAKEAAEAGNRTKSIFSSDDEP
jgi:CHASE3 domain sensor protein